MEIGPGLIFWDVCTFTLGSSSNEKLFTCLMFSGRQGDEERVSWMKRVAHVRIMRIHTKFSAEMMQEKINQKI